MFIIIPLAVLLAILVLTYIRRRRRKMKSETSKTTSFITKSAIVRNDDETKSVKDERYTETEVNDSGCDQVYIDSQGQYDHLHLRRAHKEQTEKYENHYTGIETPYQTTYFKNIELPLNEDM
ncbi:uncharacterized protein LOC134263374 [Saccostrea cucullata]|uniref:uncharacterized protein LOC134263374 n=1 Tax=Saccostrea cuccullata TaxID=36930 RepID=UPI002ED1FCD3